VKTEAPSSLGFKLEQTFFGFKPQDRVQLHENIFNLIWHGEGRWDWDTIYTMPIFLRKFYIKRVNAIIQERIDRVEQQQQKQKSRTTTKSPR
jgi:hypothetical protein